MDGISLEDLIVAALRGEHTKYNNERFGKAVFAYSRAISKSRASDLPDDLHEEVGQEALCRLMHRGPEALKDKSGLTLLRNAVFVAIRKIRADYAPPGQRSRTYVDAKAPCVAAEHIGIIPDAVELERCAIPDQKGGYDFDGFRHPTAAAEIAAFENQSEVAAILSKAPPLVSAALRLVYLEDEPIGATAQNLSLCRFAMRRAVEAFSETWRAAA